MIPNCDFGLVWINLFDDTCDIVATTSSDRCRAPPHTQVCEVTNVARNMSRTEIVARRYDEATIKLSSFAASDPVTRQTQRA
jgi:hypothetical protein